MKVAYYSPLPPSRSGIADYSALLLPELERRLEVAVVRPGRFRRTPPADVRLYHVGNDAEQHAWIVEELRRRPGVVVLHELVLHHLVVGMTIARGDSAGYLAAMEREGGLVTRLLAHAAIDHRISPIWDTRAHEFTLAREVLDHASGAIVHSRYVEDGIRRLGFAGPVWRIPHPAWPAPAVEPAAVDGGPVFGCFGHLNETKRLPQVLEAFALVRARHPVARLLLVGPSPVRLRELELPDGAHREAYVDEARLWRLMAAADVHVALRSPTMGETSGSAIRSLSVGRPLVVSDVGWFSELPDGMAVKIPVDEHEVKALAAALDALASDSRRRAAMGEAARALAAGPHAVGRVAEAYASALEDAAGGGAVRDAVLREVAQAAADVGIASDSAEAGELGERLREAGLGG
jgi:glycosyltransferase involved in cell wall biosynthesis